MPFSAMVYFLTMAIEIMIECTQHRIDHFKVYSLVVFCVFTLLYYRSPDPFCLVKIKFRSHQVTIVSSSLPLETAILISVFMNLLTLDTSYREIFK